ncbi:hypothetical protein N7537_007787 [Penicillium hordei]|uniref:Uncharacterized protein n=1 Tax=Penicillium hordei TaxID=40994 RepID=A0AAD6E0H0_9EURO|nr:uncharacterized protein N7537_007787 [Penicillium hordei]KAJ5597703.1 hypothetical protein N7537_007787 [Penicillium hordei]
MVRSYLLLGFLTAVCQPAYGLVFRDKLKQVVGGENLYLLHDVEDTTSVRFDNLQIPGTKGWKFDTEGFEDNEAVITPLDSDKTLICEEGSNCRLDLEGTKQPYVIARVSERPIFTLQDKLSQLYVSRTPDLYLELTEEISDSIYFELEKLNEGNESSGLHSREDL